MLDRLKLYKIRTDRTYEVKLSDGGAGPINIVRDLIYFRNMTDGNQYRIKIDGTNRQLIK